MACGIPSVCLPFLKYSEEDEEESEDTDSQSSRGRNGKSSGSARSLASSTGARKTNGAAKEVTERMDVDMLDMGMKGFGKPCDVFLMPPSLILPGTCILGQVCTKF